LTSSSGGRSGTACGNDTWPATGSRLVPPIAQLKASNASLRQVASVICWWVGSALVRNARSDGNTASSRSNRLKAKRVGRMSRAPFPAWKPSSTTRDNTSTLRSTSRASRIVTSGERR
jgi:hypothetical protein